MSDHDAGAGQADPGWYPDPSGRHELRWFDGSGWTASVSDRGQTSTDDPHAPSSPPAGSWTPAPGSGAAGGPPQYGGYQTAAQPAAHQGDHTPPGGVAFPDAIKRVLTKYADFSGRAPRSEYWWFTLAMFLLFFVLELLFGTDDPTAVNPVAVLAFLALLLPSLAVTVRRLHDTDRSGWWVLIGLIPFVGGIVLLVFMCLEGSKQPNEWGPPL